MPDVAMLPSLPTLPTLLAAIGIALAGFALAVAGLRRAASGPELARVPLAAEHELRIDEAGPVVLHGEGPRFTRRFGGLELRLLDRMGGAPVAARRPWLRTSVAGGSRVRQALVHFDVPKPGVYVLEVTGITVGPETAACALVLMPASGPALPLAMGATVATGAVIVAMLVAFAWRAHVSRTGDLENLSPFATEAPVESTTDTPVAPAPAEHAAAPVVLPSAGRQLRGDPDVAEALPKEAHWRGGGLTLRLPNELEVREEGEELDVRDPARISTFLVGHSTVFPPTMTGPMLVVASMTGATERVRSGLLDGYAVVRFGGVAGVVTIESRRDGANRLAIWSAYRPTKDGTRNTTVIFGAETAEFDRLEATVRAIFASARFD
jgi:hypothetical protein